MKNLLFISALFLGLSILSAQNQEKDKTLIRVEKIYDENGELLQYDSTRLDRNAHSKNKRVFYLKKDSLRPNSHFQFPDHFFDLVSLKDKYNLDSIIEQHHHTINYKLKKLEKEALLTLQNLKNELEWEERHQPEFLELKKHLKTLDSLIEVKTKEIEDAFKSFKDSKKKNT